ncbi:hypothetical protein AK812_SmicGene28521 [Symbiodinium microadriaticum]|uniref:Uncharacterized protein n=1 Tax=Symbiodinium microadriaticum TaxID=2951 RepID=A0A1Q9D468_SYMMI|nr:hypothetical protein AK812_SmicGene28521 [Symbiodinium microadriaticum]
MESQAALARAEFAEVLETRRKPPKSGRLQDPPTGSDWTEKNAAGQVKSGPKVMLIFRSDSEKVSRAELTSWVSQASTEMDPVWQNYVWNTKDKIQERRSCATKKEECFKAVEQSQVGSAAPPGLTEPCQVWAVEPWPITVDAISKVTASLRRGGYKSAQNHFDAAASYQERYEVADMLKLDLKDAAQKPVREATLQDMDSDSDWGTEIIFSSKESTAVNCSKDVTKHVAKRGLKMVAEGSEAAPANPDPSSVKIEHLWVLPAENLVKELNTLLAKLKGYTNQFKKSRVQLKASPKASEAAWLRQSNIAASLELTMKDPKKLDENECKAFVEQCQSRVSAGNLVKDMSEGMKKMCSSVLRQNSSSSIGNK